MWTFGSGLCALRPQEKDQMSETRRFLDFFLLHWAGSSGCPAPIGGSPVSYLRYAVPRTLGGTHLEAGWPWGWRCWGDECPLHSGAWKLSNFMSQGRPLLKFHRSCSGPRGGGGLGHQDCLGQCGSWRALGAVLLALAGNGREDAPFMGLCGGYRRPVLLRTAFQPGMRPLPDGLDPVHV